MNKINVLILDDEEPARLLLETYCDKLEDIHVVGLASNALEAKKLIENETVDILLSDIQMDDITGIDLVKMLRQKLVTIFTTAYSEYALEGYNLDVVDYLVKPISFQRFYQAIEKAKDLISFSEEDNKRGDSSLLSDYFFVKTNRKMVKVHFNDILFTESYGEYVKIYTQDDMILALQTTGFMETVLPQKDFIRIHRSHIVNLNHILVIEGNLVTIASHKLTISKRMKDAFMEKIRWKGII
ncbi:LytTR family DNA-binding domain-containing protein [Aureisphaera galaxeae]|uniref:LytR/AlgR family response regulator transcription factor n=1 Tax=Aureisphaera galaxeae TaxID=1538023 RepID=UPI002350F132|nr:LytTR family DNA-binding domain-containing protein [Aureisphaera galaxeae]MDC8004560.1 LytTR family DNA-binding domain-containing protein [Aureisphaera galaxeae]